MYSQVVSQNKVNHYEFTGWKVFSRMFLDFALYRSGFRLATQEWVSYLSAGVSFTKINTRYAVSSQGLLVIVTSLSKNERASIISSRTIWVARFSFQLSKILASSPNTKMENYRLITDNVHGHIKVKHSATCHELLHVGIKTIIC